MMLQAAVAGISPVEFYDLTIGEITLTIEAYYERERQNLVGRINAIIRALSQKGDPFEGLLDKAKKMRVSPVEAAKRWFWRAKE